MRLRAAAPLVLVALVLLPLPGGDPHALDLARALEGPSFDAPLGRDHLGRDVAARLAAGAIPSLVAVAIGLGATLVAGVAAGCVVALGPPPVATALRRLAETSLALPTLVVALVIAAAVGAGPATAGLALAATAWAPWAVTTAAWLDRLTGEPYWRAALALGLPLPRALARHLLPNLAPALGALAGADAARAVLLVATLGFLGLSGDTSRPDWGAMVHEYRLLAFEAPRLVLAPIAAVAFVALALHGALDRTAARR